MSLKYTLKDLRKEYVNKLEQNKKRQQKTVLEIRRLKKVRRKLNAICDNYDILLREDFHKASLIGLDEKNRLLKNTIRKDMVYYLDEISFRLSELRQKFRYRSNDAKQLKRDIARISQILGR